MALPTAVKLNANRHVTGVLRGFDQFMNLVLDNTVDEKLKADLGMVVSCGWVLQWALDALRFCGEDGAARALGSRGSGCCCAPCLTQLNAHRRGRVQCLLPVEALKLPDFYLFICWCCPCCPSCHRMLVGSRLA